jgi:hypothetical protein
MPSIVTRLVVASTIALGCLVGLQARNPAASAAPNTATGLVTLVQGTPGKTFDFYLNGISIARNVKFGTVVGPLSATPGLAKAAVRNAGAPPSSVAVLTLNTFALPGAHVIIQTDVSASGAPAMTTIVPPSVLPRDTSKTFLAVWNGTSTKQIDVYNGSVSVPHPLVQILPINSTTVIPQTWCGNGCFDKAVQIAPGTYTFNVYASGTKSQPLTAAKSITIQAGQICLLDYIGSATSKPATATSVVLRFQPTGSLNGTF